MNRPTITFRRSGTFECHRIVLADQCGHAGAQFGQTEFSFRVEIEVDTLDEQGFVADNNAIPRAMGKWDDGKLWESSCERFAGGGVLAMKELCPRAKRILVEVSPGPTAGAIVEWREGQMLPDFAPILKNEPVEMYA